MKFYKVLDVSVEATSQQIKSAYRRLATKHHPDTGGDKEKFQSIQEAYAVLSDPEKKAYYDEYGEAPIDVTDSTLAKLVADATNKAMHELLQINEEMLNDVHAFYRYINVGKPSLEELILKETNKTKKSLSVSISGMKEGVSKVQKQQTLLEGKDKTDTMEVIAVTLIKIEQSILEQIEEKEYQLEAIDEILKDLSADYTSGKEEVLHV